MSGRDWEIFFLCESGVHVDVLESIGKCVLEVEMGKVRAFGTVVEFEAIVEMRAARNLYELGG